MTLERFASARIGVTAIFALAVWADVELPSSSKQSDASTPIQVLFTQCSFKVVTVPIGS